MKIATLEGLLARLYTDAAYRREFLQDPEKMLAVTALTADERRACMDMDRQQLLTAARSFEAKRDARRVRPPVRPGAWLERLRKFRPWP